MSECALATPFLEQVCGIPFTPNQFDQRNNVYAVGQRIATMPGIDHRQSIQPQIIQSNPYRGRHDGRVHALTFDADATAVLE